MRQKKGLPSHGLHVAGMSCLGTTEEGYGATQSISGWCDSRDDGVVARAKGCVENALKHFFVEGDRVVAHCCCKNAE